MSDEPISTGARVPTGEHGVSNPHPVPPTVSPGGPPVTVVPVDGAASVYIGVPGEAPQPTPMEPPDFGFDGGTMPGDWLLPLLDARDRGGTAVCRRCAVTRPLWMFPITREGYMRTCYDCLPNDRAIDARDREAALIRGRLNQLGILRRREAKAFFLQEQAEAAALRAEFGDNYD